MSFCFLGEKFFRFADDYVMNPSHSVPSSVCCSQIEGCRLLPARLPMQLFKEFQKPVEQVQLGLYAV